MHFWMIHAFLMMLPDHQSIRGGRWQEKVTKDFFFFLVNILDIYFHGNRHSACLAPSNARKHKHLHRDERETLHF